MTPHVSLDCWLGERLLDLLIVKEIVCGLIAALRCTAQLDAGLRITG